ncbi:hypothetical protein Tco_0967052 [Tanacetum coccineum]
MQSYSSIGVIRFGNDHLAAIMGYEIKLWVIMDPKSILLGGTWTQSILYRGNFGDSDLEVALQKAYFALFIDINGTRHKLKGYLLAGKGYRIYNKNAISQWLLVNEPVPSATEINAQVVPPGTSLSTMILKMQKRVRQVLHRQQIRYTSSKSNIRNLQKNPSRRHPQSITMFFILYITLVTGYPVLGTNPSSGNVNSTHIGTQSQVN